MRIYRKIAYLFVLLCFTTAIAQDATCGPFVQKAMDTVQQGCARTGRNQACYGFTALDATPREGVTGFNFAKDGDLVSVADIESMRLSALNNSSSTWGIALMKLQANLPDTLPGQNVTFLMFGDVTLQNGVTPPAAGQTVLAAAKSAANVRGTPSTNGGIVGALASGQQVNASGRNEDSSWLRVNLAGSRQGWVFASLLTITGDVSTLPVVDSLEAAPTNPMQAFYFQTGIQQTTCAAAPADGILIQTPKGTAKIDLRANDVDIQLGSTAFLQSQRSSLMSVSVVEGEGRITANGKTVIVPAGAQVFIPVNSDMHASGSPSDPQPYQASLVTALPVSVLPVEITIAPPANDEAIRQANAQPVATAVPTVAPTQAGGGLAGAQLPGGINPAIFSGLSQEAFCRYIGTAFSQAGITKDEYIAQMQQVSAYVPADSRAQFDQFLQMLSACS